MCFLTVWEAGSLSAASLDACQGVSGAVLPTAMLIQGFDTRILTAASLPLPQHSPCCFSGHGALLLSAVYHISLTHKRILELLLESPVPHKIILSIVKSLS